jgi:hypothetical protein
MFRPMRSASLLLVAAAAACGGGPQLSNLRCRIPGKCQHAEDPFRLLLAVDFIDGSGTLSKGVLDLRVGGRTQQTVALHDLFAAQQISPDAKKGTLQVDEEVALDRIFQGEQVQVGLLATNGQGHDSNEPSLTFTLHLGQ